MQVCRICLQHIDDSECTSFDQNVTQDSIQCRLNTCVPQMELKLVAESVLCSSCIAALNFVYDFVNKCHEADSKIRAALNDSYITNLNEIHFENDEATDTKLIENIKTEIDELEIIKSDQCHETESFSHNGEQGFQDINNEVGQCNKCDYKTKRKQDLQRHLKVHNGIWYRCKYCKHMCESLFYLRKHTFEEHTKASSYICDICGAHCKSHLLLQRHYVVHSDSKPYMCDVCGRKYCGIYSLKQHIKTHKGDRPFSCSVCLYTCTSKYLLNAHQRTHTGEKPYLCELCGFRTSNSSHFIYHKQLHTGQKRFKCELCNYRCLTKSSMNVHLRAHRGEKPFECYNCGYKSTTLSHLKEHIRVHTGEKPYSCEYCDYRCSRRSHLVVHLNVHPKYKHKPKHLRCYNCSFVTMIPTLLQEHVCNDHNKIKLEPFAEMI